VTTMKLGLIGGNIAASRAPYLHGFAGRQFGIDVTYDLLTPAQLGKDFDAVFAGCRTGCYRGINVTYPYKEVAAGMVRVDDPSVRAIGAVNTVTFEADGPRGFNTDYSGFVAGFCATFGDMTPGAVCMVGAGGVGKAVAFGLATLGVREIRLVDKDGPRAAALAAQVAAVVTGGNIQAVDDLKDAARGAEGFINCTPVGMVGYGGTPLPRELLRGGRWAFDAVYTPLDTPFLGDAEAEGLRIMSGYELFFHQGVDAWKIFSGRDVDPARLRADLQTFA
jgi:shikimate dehydrogenase